MHRDAWALFRHHHYLDTSLHRAARCWCAFWNDTPVAFASVLPHPGKFGAWREHRTVCLPDFQGVGIGNALSAFVGSVVTAVQQRYSSVTGNPAMIHARARSPRWQLARRSSLVSAPQDISLEFGTSSSDRLTTTFRYVGPKADRKLAQAMWAGE